MRSSLSPWKNLVVLMKFLVIGIIQTTMAKITTAARHGNRKMMANLGRTGTTNNGRTEIISHGKNKDKKSWQNNKE